MRIDNCSNKIFHNLLTLIYLLDLWINIDLSWDLYNFSLNFWFWILFFKVNFCWYLNNKEILLWYFRKFAQTFTPCLYLYISFLLFTLFLNIDYLSFLHLHIHFDRNLKRNKQLLFYNFFNLNINLNWNL